MAGLKRAINLWRANRFIRWKSAQIDGLTQSRTVGHAAFGAPHAGVSHWDLRIRRAGRGYRLTCNADAALQRRFCKNAGWRALPYLAYMHRAGPSVDDLLVDVSDGDRPGFAELGFSSADPRRVLVPDLYFYQTGGFAAERRARRESDVPWAERDDGIVWRGGLNGHGITLPDPALATNGLLNQRLRLALACRDSDIDVRFTGRFDAAPALDRLGLMGARIAPASWLNRKFAIDIDGFSNTWDNLFIRLLFGCCVLKVDSQVGFRQWYYDRLRPYEHYVPIKADLSDLDHQVDWVRSNPAKAEEIARTGSALAQSMTFESETEFAAQEILSLCRTRQTVTTDSAS